jgi:hypothetical protein
MAKNQPDLNSYQPARIDMRCQHSKCVHKHCVGFSRWAENLFWARITRFFIANQNFMVGHGGVTACKLIGKQI